MKKRRLTEEEITALRDQAVAQDNEFIRQSRVQMTAMEQNMVLYLISKIKPKDMELMEVNFTVDEFCQVCGLENVGGKDYRAVKGALKALADKSGWIVTSYGSTLLVRWLDYMEIFTNSGKMKVRLSQTIKPFLIGLISKGNYTQALLVNYLAMQSVYSKRLYELLKSYTVEKPEKAYRPVVQEFEIGELKKIIGAEKYKLYADFKRRVLEQAMREINEVTDIAASYTPEKRHGRAVSHISFFFQHKQPVERYAARKTAGDVLDN